MLAFFDNTTGIVVVIIAIVLLFGASQLPKLARSLGEAGRELKKAQRETESGDQQPQPAVPVQTGDDHVTLSKADLEALLDEREARAKNHPPVN